MSALCRRVADSGWFQNSILGIILFNAAIMGLETSRTLMASYGSLFGWLNVAVQIVFVVELTVRVVPHWSRVLKFFRDGWNVFDVGVVAASLLPEVRPFATVARLARLTRVTRVLSFFPELRLIVGTMLRSIPSMRHVVLLLALLLYVYGILGFFMFQAHDPKHWCTLGASVSTLFQILTLQGWVEIQAASLAAYARASVSYASFIVIAVFVVINLFIAVMINNFVAAKKYQLAARDLQSPSYELLRRIAALKANLSKLERQFCRAHHDSNEAKPTATADRRLRV